MVFVPTTPFRIETLRRVLRSKAALDGAMARRFGRGEVEEGSTDVEEEAMSVEARADAGERTRGGERRASTFRSGVADVSESLDGRAWRTAEVDGKSNSEGDVCGSRGAEVEDRGWPSSSRRTVDGRRTSGSDGRGEFGGETEGRGRSGSRMGRTGDSGDNQCVTDAERPANHRMLEKWEINGHLIGERVKVHWPEDNSWWSGEVVEIGPQHKSITVLYESGELEKISGGDLREVLSKGHMLVECARHRPSYELGAPIVCMQTTERAVDSSNGRVVTSAFPSPMQFNVPMERQEHESVCDMPPNDPEHSLAPPTFRDAKQNALERQLNIQSDSTDRNFVDRPRHGLQVGLDRQAATTAKPAAENTRPPNFGEGGLIAVGSQVLAGVRLEKSRAGPSGKQIKAESTADGGEHQTGNVSAEFDWQLHLHHSKKRGRVLHNNRDKAKKKRAEGSLVSDPVATWDPPDSARAECAQHARREATSAERAVSTANISHDSRRSPLGSAQFAQHNPEPKGQVPQARQEISYISDAEHPGRKLEAEVSILCKQAAEKDGDDMQHCQQREAHGLDLMGTTHSFLDPQDESAGFTLRAIRADSNITDAQHPLEPEHTIVTDIGTIHGVGVSAGEPVPSTAHAYSDDSKSAMARSNKDTSVVSSDARVMV